MKIHFLLFISVLIMTPSLCAMKKSTKKKRSSARGVIYLPEHRPQRPLEIDEERFKKAIADHRESISVLASMDDPIVKPTPVKQEDDPVAPPENNCLTNIVPALGLGGAALLASSCPKVGSVMLFASAVLCVYEARCCGSHDKE